eukprot:jgi/Hompol1/5935/HPOL_004791-RA
MECQPIALLDAQRGYDRYKYRAKKRLLKQKLNQDDIEFPFAFSVFKSYTLGQELPVTAHIKVPSSESGSKPLRGDVTLPHQVGEQSTSRVLVFATGEQAEEAKRLGATYVGGDDLIKEVLEDRVQFDRCLSTKEMFPKVIKIAKKLGPKGLMPSTVSDDLSQMMASLRGSTKLEPTPNGFINLEIGKSTWTPEDVEANIRALVNAVIAMRPSKTDASRFVQDISISGPHTAGVKLPKGLFVPKPTRPVDEISALLASYGLTKFGAVDVRKTQKYAKKR